MISSSNGKSTFQKGIKYFTLDAVEKIESELSYSILSYLRKLSYSLNLI